jgi:hypothetical protein
MRSTVRLNKRINAEMQLISHLAVSEMGLEGLNDAFARRMARPGETSALTSVAPVNKKGALPCHRQATDKTPTLRRQPPLMAVADLFVVETKWKSYFSHSCSTARKLRQRATKHYNVSAVKNPSNRENNRTRGKRAW